MRVEMNQELPLHQRLIRLAIGLAGLTAMAAFFMSGVTPPGVCGEVLRHNRANHIDASPLFYSEVEHMPALEAALDSTIAAQREARRESGE